MVNKYAKGFLLIPLLLGIMTTCISLTGIMAAYGFGIGLLVKERKWHQAMNLAQETMAKFHLGEKISNCEADDLRMEVTESMLPVRGNIRQIEIKVFLQGKVEPLLTIVTYD